MSKLTMSAALAAILTAAAPAAFADTPISAAPAANHVLPDQVRFTDMNGATVYDGQKNAIGDINNVVLDPNGKIAAIVIKTGAFLGIGGKTVAVTMKDLKVTREDNGRQRFVLDMTKDQLKSAQAYDVNPAHNTENGSSTPPARSTRQ